MMFKKIGFLIVFTLVVSNSLAQKIMEKELDAANYSVIEINSDVIYHINISTENSDKIKITTHVEGENYENVVLSIKENDEQLNIEPMFTPYFEAKNDKLAAHKVLAIEMELRIPENLSIRINSSLSSVKAKGKFLSFEALLGDGNCILEEFIGNAAIKTKQGFIKVFAKHTVSGKAFSKKGKVFNALEKKGKFAIEAESLEGDISLFLIE